MSFLKHLLPAWKVNLEKRGTANAAILSALDKELTDAEEEAIRSKLMLYLDTATGQWLDQYGEIFGLIRLDGEPDNEYRQRIIDYVQVERGTIPAIIAALQRFLKDYESHIEVYEPYNNVFYLNKSKLNGEDHFLGHYYTVAVIDVKFARTFPPAGVLEVINEFKPAGVKVHTTHRPRGYNPNADIIEVPNELYPVRSYITSMNGMDNIVKGHLNLTERSREGDGDDIFILNKSHLNSLDVLAGSFSAVRPNYNLATYSQEDLSFNHDTRIIDVFNQTEEMSTDFYIHTKYKDDLYASHTIEDLPTYMYLTLDVKTYIDLNYSSQLNDIEPSGVYTRDTYLALTEKPKLYFSLRSNTSPSSPVDYDIQIFNLNTEQWDTIHSGQAIYHRLEEGNLDLESLDDYLSEGGLVFSRIKVREGVPVFDIMVHFYELGFYKHIGVKPMIDVSFYKDIISLSEVGAGTLLRIENGISDIFTRPKPGSIESMLFFNEKDPEMVDNVPVDRLRMSSKTTVIEE